MHHLGNVLQMFAELSEGDRSNVFDFAMDFYNKNNPDMQVLPEDGYEISLQMRTPISRFVSSDKLRLAYERFHKKDIEEFPIEDYDIVAEALQTFQNKHPLYDGRAISPNRICAMLAIEAMYEWEEEEWKKD